MTNDAMTGDAERQCLAVAERLLRPETVMAALPAGVAGSLADGLPGTALLHARLAVVHADFATAAANHWTHAARQTPRGVNRTGVFHAGAGLAASLIIGVPYLPDPARHATSTARAARWLSTQAVTLAERHRAALTDGAMGTPGTSTTSSPASPGPAGSCSPPTSQGTPPPNPGSSPRSPHSPR